MALRTAGQPEFKRMSSRIFGSAKKWFKQYTARRNRKTLRQARDIEDHRDKPLDPWAID